MCRSPLRADRSGFRTDGNPYRHCLTGHVRSGVEEGRPNRIGRPRCDRPPPDAKNSVRANVFRVAPAGSTDRCNTFGELLSWGLIEQGLSRPFIKLPCYCAQLGLAMPGEIRAARKILAQ